MRYLSLLFLILTGLILSAPTMASGSLTDAAIQHAYNLNGISRYGQSLYVIILASTQHEYQAKQRLEVVTRANPDLGAWFIVQKSNNFEGMNPGWYVAMAAFENKANALQQLKRISRVVRHANIKQAIPRTHDPYPYMNKRIQSEAAM